MTQRPPLRLITVIFAALIAMVATGIFIPTAAQAAPSAVSVRYVAGANWPIGPYQWKATTVSCPAGMKVVGGGEDNSSTSRVLLQSSEPTADGNSWRIAVRNVGWAQLTFRAWAMCASGLSNYSIQSSPDETVPGHGTAYIPTYCSDGLLGLGFHTADNADVGANAGIVYNWSAYFFQAMTTIKNASSDPAAARTVVVCGAGFELWHPINDGVVARPGEAVSATASCAADQFLVGGGTAAPGPSSTGPEAETVSSQPLPIDATRASTWRTTLYNNSTTPQTFHAQAFCAAPTQTP